MTGPIPVCPFESRIISHFRGATLAVRVEEPASIPAAKELVERHNRLHCIILTTPHSLAQLDLTDAMKGIPTAVFVPEIGGLGGLLEKLPLLQQLAIMVYLPAEREENCRDARVLSSLGIATALLLDSPLVDWDVLGDLLSYYAFGRIRHALIEPFNYVISNYVRNAFVDFSPVYFDKPSRYVHLSEDGRIALHSGDVREGPFIADMDSLAGIGEDPRCRDCSDATYSLFLEQDGCAYCGAFRICLGKYRNGGAENPGCEKLFGSLLDIAENSKKNDPKLLWQP